MTFKEKCLRLLYLLIDVILIVILIPYNYLVTVFVLVTQRLSNKKYSERCSSLLIHWHRTTRCEDCKHIIYPFQKVNSGSMITMSKPFHKREIFKKKGPHKFFGKVYLQIICTECYDRDRMEHIL